MFSISNFVFDFDFIVYVKHVLYIITLFDLVMSLLSLYVFTHTCHCKVCLFGGRR